MVTHTDCSAGRIGGRKQWYLWLPRVLTPPCLKNNEMLHIVLPAVERVVSPTVECFALLMIRRCPDGVIRVPFFRRSSRHLAGADPKLRPMFLGLQRLLK